MESMPGRLVLASRWLLAVFLFGLMAGLALFALRFLHELWEMALGILRVEDIDALITLLHLIDYTLVASLVVMVALATWDSSVSSTGSDSGRWRARSAMNPPLR